MTLLLCLRHAPTDWSLAGKLQGGADRPLDPQAARLWAHAVRLPPPFAVAPCYASPLRRGVESARLLGFQPRIEPALSEMGWGEWEGADREMLARLLGDGPPRRGLDFAPPGGESPRAVQARLAPFLARLASDGRDAVAIAHKGVIRALYAAAVGWRMETPPPDRLDFTHGQLFRLGPDGAPAVERLNWRLAP